MTYIDTYVAAKESFKALKTKCFQNWSNHQKNTETFRGLVANLENLKLLKFVSEK